MIDICDNEYYLLKEYLLKTSGIEVAAEKRYLFTTRLSDFLTKINCSSFSEFYFYVNNDKSLHQQFIEAMTTNETSFFRDHHPFYTLQNILLPEIAQKKMASKSKKIFMWSLGCSTGQEPYSIAITVSEWIRLQNTFQQDDILIFASDISEKVIAKAKNGSYTDEEIARGISDAYKLRYFMKDRNLWQIIPSIKRMIQFSEINLSNPISWFGYFDIILCRNVMIYFTIELRKKIIQQFYDMLQPGGILFLGASESLYSLSTLFETEYYDETVVYRAIK